MSKMMITAAIAAMAFIATAADARQTARQRGVASGQEARERTTTKDLNAQQLASVGAGAGGMNQPGMAPQGMQQGMAPTTAAPAPAGDAGSTMPQAPDAAAGPAAPMEAEAAPMSHDMAHAPNTTASAETMTERDGKWYMGDRPATKAEIKAHKQMMKTPS